MLWQEKKEVLPNPLRFILYLSYRMAWIECLLIKTEINLFGLSFYFCCNWYFLYYFVLHIYLQLFISGCIIKFAISLLISYAFVFFTLFVFFDPS